jgi:glycosyltransferase involved in cell wall biosynthesis
MSDHPAIMQVVDGLQVGGKERLAVSLANKLSAMGWRSFLASSRDAEGPLAADIAQGVTLWAADRSSRFELAGLKRIARFIDDQKIDVVHTHNHFSAYLMRVVLWMSSRKPVHVAHDHHGPAMGDRVVGFYDWLMLRHVDAYVSVSQELQARASRLLKLPEDRCLYIRNGIDIDPPHDAWSGAPTVVQVANLLEPKGHQTAAQAASIIKKNIEGFRWVCLGRKACPPTPYVSQLEQTIASLDLQDCMLLPGQCLEVRRLLRQANVGVIASDSEGLPLAMLEYMAEQLPVVTTDVGQCADIINQAQAGIVVPPGDGDALAQAVIKLLRDAGLARRLGANGRKFVQERFSTDAMVQQFVSLYNMLLSQRK